MSIASLAPSGILRGDHLLLLDEDLQELTRKELRELIANIGASLSGLAFSDAKEKSGMHRAFVDRSLKETQRNLERNQDQPIGIKPHRW